MTNFISAIFCVQCGSRYVEVNRWNKGKAVFHCRTCDVEEEISNFTLGRCGVSNVELQRARDSRATRGKPER